MQCAASKHTLKNGVSILIRSLCAADAQQVLAHRICVCGETENLSRYPDEIRITQEEERAILHKQEQNPKGVMLGAFAGDQLVAMASVLPISDSHERYRHRGSFGISVIRDFWNLGIATLLIPLVSKCARQAGYEQIELEVLAGNEKAISLYQRHGFREYGRRPHDVKMRDGAYRDALLMLRAL